MNQRCRDQILLTINYVLCRIRQGNTILIEHYLNALYSLSIVMQLDSIWEGR